jgi:hypothetical protein
VPLLLERASRTVPTDISPYMDAIEHVIRYTHQKFVRSMDVDLEEMRGTVYTRLLETDYLSRFDPAVGRLHIFLFGFIVNLYRKEYGVQKHPVNNAVSLDAADEDEDPKIMELVAPTPNDDYWIQVQSILDILHAEERCTSVACHTYDYPFGPPDYRDLNHVTVPKLSSALSVRGKYICQCRIEAADIPNVLAFPRKLSVIFGLLSLGYIQTEVMSILNVSKTFISSKVGELSRVEPIREWLIGDNKYTGRRKLDGDGNNDD